MRINPIRPALAMVLLVLGIQLCYPQGTFVNLSFEGATIVPDPASPYYPHAVYADTAIPGWTAYINGNQQSDIIYNSQSTGGAGVVIHDSKSPYLLPLAGNYSVFLNGSFPGPMASAAIGQTGQVPSDAASLRFRQLPTSTLQVTFNGQPIQLSLIRAGSGFDIVGGDISMFAGQTGELLFTTLPNMGAFIDNILFSNQPIPEPSTLGLFALGALFFGWRLWRKPRP